MRACVRVRLNSISECGGQSAVTLRMHPTSRGCMYAFWSTSLNIHCVSVGPLHPSRIAFTTRGVIAIGLLYTVVYWSDAILRVTKLRLLVSCAVWCMYTHYV